MTDIYKSMPKTFAVTDQFKSGWNEIEDCRIMRKNLLFFELEGCHKFTWSLYVAIVVIAVGLFILVLSSWTLFCFIRITGNQVDVKPPP